jgi:SAM-dependent methyltransferase
MSDAGCIFCHSDSQDIVIEENGFTGRRCPDCGLIYVSPRPSPQVIQQLYSQDEAHFSAERQLAAAYYSTLRARHNLLIIKKYVGQGRLLEIGAGAGCFASQAQKAGFTPYAVESSPVLAQFINGQHKITCKSSLNDFANMRFDIVYHCDVLSHFYDPIEDFRQINNLLADNGLLVFETGNLADVSSGYLGFIDCFQYPEHLFFFGRKSIGKLLDAAGFELIEIHSRNILFVLAALWCKNRIENIFSFLRPKRRQTDISSDRRIADNSYGSKPRLAQKIYNTFIYALIYELGRVHLPNCPQTLLVIARKK